MHDQKTMTGKGHIYVGFESLTALVVKSSVLWDILMYSPLKLNKNSVCYLLHVGL
jgi:hypothetical protein